jgi:hypothetical protein
MLKAKKGSNSTQKSELKQLKVFKKKTNDEKMKVLEGNEKRTAYRE